MHSIVEQRSFIGQNVEAVYKTSPIGSLVGTSPSAPMGIVSLTICLVRFYVWSDKSIPTFLSNRIVHTDITELKNRYAFCSNFLPRLRIGGYRLRWNL